MSKDEYAFRGDQHEPRGGMLGSKVTATISIFQGNLEAGEIVKVIGDVSATDAQFAEAASYAAELGYILTHEGGAYYLRKQV